LARSLGGRALMLEAFLVVCIATLVSVVCLGVIVQLAWRMEGRS
jgi:hypothetical protein